MNIKLEDLVRESAKAIVGYSVDGVEVIDGNPVFYSDFIDDYYCNLAHIYNFNNQAIKKIINFFKKRELPVALYVLDKKIEEVIQNDYKQVNEDIYMIIEKPIRFESNEIKVKQVSNQNEEDEFLSIFQKVFCEGDGVYGGISKGYLDAIKQYFKKFPKKKHKDFIASIDGITVGTISIIIQNNLVIASSLAVLPKYRGLGVSKALLSVALNPFIEKKLCTLCTEHNSVNEKIYKKIGFKTVGTAKTYLKKE